MDDVKRYGDSAIIKYTKKLDGVQLKTLKVTTEEIKQAYTLVSKGQIRSIVIMKKDLAKSERVLLSRLNGMVISSNGIKLRRSVLPIPSVGCYIPGGKAHYPQSCSNVRSPSKDRRRKKNSGNIPTNEKWKHRSPYSCCCLTFVGLMNFTKSVVLKELRL